MGRAKIVLYSSKKLSDGTHPIMLRISVLKKIKYISLGYSCKLEHWDPDHEQPNENYITAKYPVKYQDLMDHLEEIRVKYKRIIRDLQNKGIKHWSIEDFVNSYYKSQTKPRNVLEYFDQISVRLRASNEMGNADVYQATKNSIKRFLESGARPKKDISFSEVTPAFLNRFIEFHKGLNNKPGYISHLIRTFRALYNRAILDGYALEENYPFRKIKIEKAVPFKRAISQEDIIKIKKVYLEEPELNLARDLFLFSFYTRGMNFIDIALLKLSNIDDDKITYIRAKTRKSSESKFIIGIMPQAQEILDKYLTSKVEKDYLFPVLFPRHKTATSIHNRIKKIRHQVNNDIQIVAQKAGVKGKVTFYVARHSFATIMKYKKVSTEMIQELLGHTDVKTTEDYLKSFGNEVLDQQAQENIDF